MQWKILPAAELDRHLATLEALNALGCGTPLLSAEFLRPLLREFGSGGELLALHEDAGAPSAMALLVPQGRGMWHTFQPSQNPVGAWLQRPELPVEPLLASLTQALPGLALSVAVTQQDPDLLARPADGARTSTLDYIRTARVPVTGTFGQYWEARGKNLKQNMKKQRNRLEKDGIQARLEMVTAPDDIAQAIADYGQLESAGWKAQGGTAIHPDNAQGRFYRAMLENFCRQGRGRVYRYRFNDKVVAVDLCIEGNASLIILKTTHDESQKVYSPAFLMRQESFARLFEEQRIRRIEFYGKLMEWHTRWSEDVRTMYHVNHYRWAVLPKLRRMLGRHRAEPADG